MIYLYKSSDRDTVTTLLYFEKIFIAPEGVLRQGYEKGVVGRLVLR